MTAESRHIVCPHCLLTDETRKNPGITHANTAALAVEGSVIAPVFAEERPTDHFLLIPPMTRSLAIALAIAANAVPGLLRAQAPCGA